MPLAASTVKGIRISMETRQCPELQLGSVSRGRNTALDAASSRQALHSLSRPLSGECSYIMVRQARGATEGSGDLLSALWAEVGGSGFALIATRDRQRTGTCAAKVTSESLWG